VQGISLTAFFSLFLRLLYLTGDGSPGGQAVDDIRRGRILRLAEQMRRTRYGYTVFPEWKFEAPRLGARLLMRERLLSRVERCLGSTPPRSGDILLVSAPAGYGKSTLLAQWAKSTSLPVVWYHLDQSDQDPATFLRGITQALHRKFPRPRWTVELVLNHLRSHLLGEADIARAVGVLAADIEQHVTRPSALILTGVAELGTSSSGLLVLDHLLSRRLDRLRLALEWREAPQVSFSSLIAEQRIAAIGRDDLCLTRDELDALLTLAGASPDPSFREQVGRLTTGWVAGAVLATGVQAPLSSPAQDASELDQTAVTDYLAHQVISALPPELVKFATEAAILRYMTPTLCSRLLSLSAGVARERLGALERTTGFVSRTGQRPQTLVYRFQPLLRQALAARLSALPTGNERIRDLHARAADLLEEQGDLEEAIYHYLEAGSFARIADLIESVQEEYLRASRGLLLTRWLELLPAAVFRSRPHLQVLQADLYRYSGRRSQALKLAGRARRRLEMAGPCASEKEPGTGDPGAVMSQAICGRMAAQATIICAEVLNDLGSYRHAQKTCLEALSLLSQASDAGADVASLEGLYARANEALSASVMVTEGPLAAEPYLRACEQYSLYSGDLWKVGRHHYHRSRVYMQEGNFERAESAAVAALLAAQEAHDEIYAISSRLNLGAIKLRRGQAAAAREELDTALVAAESAGYTLGRLYALANLADLALTCGAYAEAIEWYERVFEVFGAERIEETRHLRIVVLAGLGYALTLSGRPEEALIRLTPALKPGRRSRWRQPRPGPIQRLQLEHADDVIVALSLGFAYLRHGLPSYAENLFALADDVALEQKNFLKAAQAHFFLAAARLAEKDETGADTHLVEALDHGLAVHDPLVLAIEVCRVPEVWSRLARLGHPLAADLLQTAQARSWVDSTDQRQDWNGATGAAIGSRDQPARLGGSVEPGGRRGGGKALEQSQAETERKNIRVFLFGQARVLVGTAYVTRWRKPAARDLLLFLLHHQKPASRETILTALWPDSDPELSDAWFRQARFHLQHTLQRDCLVQEEGGSYWRLDLPCWVDVYEAERLAAEGELLLSAGDRLGGADRLRQALTLWQGPYLDDLYGDWTAARRQELYHRRLSYLERLAGLELDTASPDSAMQLYQQILMTEPYYEQAHRGLMRCFAARGEPSRAIQQFRALAARLREDMHTIPAKETFALCQSILEEMEASESAFAPIVSRTRAFS
jgi:ATP/maltotriose-dependent transcriptional regulator MalT/DNA-binding SARP family transcriptional activator